MSEPVTYPVVSALPGTAKDFYRSVLRRLSEAGVPFLAGGAYALQHYTGVVRETKDLDLFLRESDLSAAAAALDELGCRTHCFAPHWLWKARAPEGDCFVDLIFSSGNGIAAVDEVWFERAVRADVLGVEVEICPAEEIIWSKSFIMERERFDGADVAHLLHALARRLDWQRLLSRFADHWRILLAHLVMFGFVYPGRRHDVPSWVMEELASRLAGELDGPAEVTTCRGPILSREQYLLDVEERGYRDGRLPPTGTMTAGEIELWRRRSDEEE